MAVISEKSLRLSSDDDDNTPEILLTDFGWMNAAHPDVAESEPRSKWGALMQAAIQDHPWYNPTGWAEVVASSSSFSSSSSRKRRNNSNSTAAVRLSKKTRYVFLDVETCGEPNWPIYVPGDGPETPMPGGASC